MANLSKHNFSDPGYDPRYYSLDDGVVGNLLPTNYGTGTGSVTLQHINSSVCGTATFVPGTIGTAAPVLHLTPDLAALYGFDPAEPDEAELEAFEQTKLDLLALWERIK